ncbi:MAG TPA: acetyltransferase [Casimicrobiaceae bacterium]|nr:acetyltransferase [Casimicrobiaceae bacterium]
MKYYDVFNGDADGICALHQLRLDEPRDAVLVTGAKRDIKLLARVDAKPGDAVTVLDISMASNRPALIALLERGVAVQYFDHHFAGELPQHPNLAAAIDTSPRVCTGIIVDRHLKGRQRIWAAVAAFGDDLEEPACALAASLGLDASRVASLRELGEALAYNAYGDSEGDLIVHPAELYGTVARYADPFALLREEPVIAQISETRREDLALARGLKPAHELACASVYVLPDAAWSRRVRGALGNELAQQRPDRAHAILTPDARGGYTVSVRAPREKPVGADSLCRSFSSGGGRAAAAGINHLPAGELPELVRRLEEAFG